MRVEKLRKVLKGTGAKIIEVENTVVVVPRHSYRLASNGEVIDDLARNFPRILGRAILPSSDDPDNLYTSVMLGVEYFDDLDDIRIRFYQKKILACDCPDIALGTRSGKYRVRSVVFGENDRWGPRKMRGVKEEG